MIRVHSGRYKKTKLKSPKKARTLQTRMRQHLIGYLSDFLKNATVLDLFAGSGIFGIEALSSGAAQAVFVDKNRKTTQLIQANLNKLGLAEKSRVVTADASLFLTKAKQNPHERFDIIFIDPPYTAVFKKTQEQQKRYIRSLLHKAAQILNPKSLIILKVHKKHPVYLPAGLAILDVKKSGINRLYYLVQERYVKPEFRDNLSFGPTDEKFKSIHAH